MLLRRYPIQRCDTGHKRPKVEPSIKRQKECGRTEPRWYQVRRLRPLRTLRTIDRLLGCARPLSLRHTDSLVGPHGQHTAGEFRGEKGTRCGRAVVGQQLPLLLPVGVGFWSRHLTCDEIGYREIPLMSNEVLEYAIYFKCAGDNAIAIPHQFRSRDLLEFVAGTWSRLQF